MGEPACGGPCLLKRVLAGLEDGLSSCVSQVEVGVLEYSRGAIYRGRYTSSRAALGVLEISKSAIYRGRQLPEGKLASTSLSWQGSWLVRILNILL